VGHLAAILVAVISYSSPGEDLGAGWTRCCRSRRGGDRGQLAAGLGRVLVHTGRCGAGGGGWQEGAGAELFSVEGVFSASWSY